MKMSTYALKDMNILKIDKYSNKYTYLMFSGRSKVIHRILFYQFFNEITKRFVLKI